MQCNAMQCSATQYSLNVKKILAVIAVIKSRVKSQKILAVIKSQVFGLNERFIYEFHIFIISQYSLLVQFLKGFSELTYNCMVPYYKIQVQRFKIHCFLAKFINMYLV